MTNSPSKIAGNRKAGKHQADGLRARILDAAEALFLEKGIEAVSMGDVAARLDISRVTVYRYFANRDEIAVAIQVRMLEKINAVPPVQAQPPSLDDYREGIRAILRDYVRLRDAYRYIGMFDAIYLDRAADNALTQWTKLQLGRSAMSEQVVGSLPMHQAYGNRLGIILDTFTWVLEKLALRGEFTWGDSSVPLEENLQFFERILLQALDLLRTEDELSSQPVKGKGAYGHD